MKTSQSLTNITKALLAAQKSITFAAKDSNNPFFKSKYADLETVIDAVKPSLNENGIVFIQTLSESDVGYLGITTRLMHVSGEFLEDSCFVPLQKNDAQGYGSTATYARRYALSAICGLYQADDDGNEGSKKAEPKKTISPTDGALEKLDVDMQTALADLSKEIVDAFERNSHDEIKELVGAVQDADQKVALWELLKPHSKVRALIKSFKGQ